MVFLKVAGKIHICFKRHLRRHVEHPKPIKINILYITRQIASHTLMAHRSIECHTAVKQLVVAVESGTRLAFVDNCVECYTGQIINRIDEVGHNGIDIESRM